MAIRGPLSTIPNPDPVPEIGKWYELEPGGLETISSLHLQTGVALEMSTTTDDAGLITKVTRVPRNNYPADAIIDGYEVHYSHGLQRYFTAPSGGVTGNVAEALPGVPFTFSIESDASVIIDNEHGKEPVHYRFLKLSDALKYEPGVHLTEVGGDAMLEGFLDTNKKVLGFSKRAVGPSKYSHTNEDSFGFSKKRVVVADGVGSRYHAELASHLAVESILTDQSDFEQSLDNARVNLESHNANFVRWVGTDLSPDTVFVAVEVNGNEVTLAHSGDAKWRLFHKGEVIDRSKDHSLVQQKIDAKDITEKEAITHDERNVITSSLSFGKTSIKKLTVPPGAILMLCSDGLDGVTDEEIISLHEKHLNRYTVLSEIEKLVAFRNTSGLILASYKEDKKVKLDYFQAAPYDNLTVAFVYF